MNNQFSSPVGNLEDYFLTEYWLIDQYIGDQLWGWGSNGAGDLGINDTINRSTPVTTFAGGNNWKQISTVGGVSAAIKTDGSLWVWGGSSGGIGINNTINKSTPVTTFAGGNDWKYVNAGNAFSAIKVDGSLWVWGQNGYGQLGVGDTSDRLTPVTTFSGGNDWKFTVARTNKMSAIKIDGSLWVWGENNYGQLGINAITTGILTPVTTFAGGNNWRICDIGDSNLTAVKTDGTLWVWGRNDNGQLGNNNTNNSLTPVTTFLGGTDWKQSRLGGSFGAAIKIDGSLWTWGFNSNGQLGTNDITQRNTPVTTFAGGNNWKQVICSPQTPAAIKTDGSLWTWGRNNYGQLGINSTVNKSTPVTTFLGGNNWRQLSSGGFQTMAVTSGIPADLPLS